EAVDLARQALRLDPTGDPRSLRSLADQLARTGRLDDEARSWYCLAVALPDEDPEGLAAARRATELDAGYFAAWYQLAERLHERGDTSAAVRAVAAGAAARPGDHYVQRTAASKLRRFARPAEAEQYADRAVDLAPLDASMWVERVRVLGAAGRWDEAFAAAGTAAELAAAYPGETESDVAEWLRWLGLDLAEAGRHAEAVAVTTDAVEIYRRLAARDPDRFEPDLAAVSESLDERSAALDRVARPGLLARLVALLRNA
ncbi:MAG: tetratricopeptide repeat protein, partial [Dactylosporangium sp.]|nr:tetratricopeptide repeat protein [Dactylosporangium sp.]NNJ60169.1 tetratricopeptide repeat protein [Dactylosporangium sp.]